MPPAKFSCDIVDTFVIAYAHDTDTTTSITLDILAILCDRNEYRPKTRLDVLTRGN